MSSRAASLALILGLAGASPALAQQHHLAPGAECLRPEPPIIPDSSFASRMQMDGVKLSVWRFSSAAQDYRNCLQQALVSAKDEASPAQKQNWLAAIRASYDEERMLRQSLSMQMMRRELRF